MKRGSRSCAGQISSYLSGFPRISVLILPYGNVILVTEVPSYLAVNLSLFGDPKVHHLSLLFAFWYPLSCSSTYLTSFTIAP